MFKSFIDFLTEAKKSTLRGNYVSVKTSLERGDADIGNGVFTKSPHVTLMYSPETEIEFKEIDKILKKFKEPMTAIFEGIDIFGDSESEGNKAVVLKLKCAT